MRPHATSATYTFVTMAAAPTITTDGASNLTNVSATLNATLDSNGTSTDVTFEWDTNSGAPYANETTPAFNWSTDGDKAVTKGITGLAASTPYYYRAKAVYSGGTIYGSEQSFSTTADPAVEAAQEARMQVYEYKRKYGVILTASPLFFTLQTPSGTNSNTFVVSGHGGSRGLSDFQGRRSVRPDDQPARHPRQRLHPRPHRRRDGGERDRHRDQGRGRGPRLP